MRLGSGELHAAEYDANDESRAAHRHLMELGKLWRVMGMVRGREGVVGC